MRTRVIIDSRAREGGTVNDFFIELRPTIENIRKVSLIWADIPTPLQTPGGPYFLVRVPELGTSARVLSQRNGASGTETTYVVPITVNVDERVFWSPKTSFKQEMEYTPAISLQRLSVIITIISMLLP